MRFEFSDSILQKLIKQYPKPVFEDRSERLFERLVEAIVSQQLSVKAADTIFARFQKLFSLRHSGLVPLPRSKYSLSNPKSTKGKKKILNPLLAQDFVATQQVQDDGAALIFPTPQQVLKMPDEKIREAGISFRKISYIKGIATAFIGKKIIAEEINALSDEEVIIKLTEIKGIGKWTAEMILIFTLQRPDIFSYGDLGLRRAIEKLYGITQEKKVIELSETWKPHRSTASWYLWRSLEND